MNRVRLFRASGLIAVLCLALVVLLASAARPAEAVRSVAVEPAVTEWLVAAGPQDTATFLVGLKDDGTQAESDRASGIANKLARRARVDELLTARSGRNSGALGNFLRARGLGAGVTAVTAYKTFDGFALTANKQVIEALQKWERVATIETDHVVYINQPEWSEPLQQINAVEWNISKIGADRVWNELGVNGTGAVVANIDTGVRYTHQALSANYKCAGGSHTNCWKDVVGNQTVPYDDNNHGTHTMGTAVGSGGIGVAPGAKWIACKGLSGSGSGTSSGLLSCGDWMLAPGGSSANAPDVVNNSWGSTNTTDTWFQQTVRNWRNAGIFPTFSNGNSGPSCSTVGVPAAYPESFGVGATDSNDVIASFSSRGPANGFGNILKPQVSAPGSNVRSALGSGDTAYGTMSGTSMAGPHVTGLVALLVSKNSSLTVAQLTSNMQTYALGISSTSCSSSGIPNNVYGYGRIRAYESVNAAGGGGPTPTPPPGPTPTPTPVPPPGGEVVVNGGFENGRTPWVESAANGYELIDPTRPHTGAYSVWLAGYNNANDLIYQTITVPTNGTLTYWWYMSSSEGSTTAYDYMYVRLYTTGGTLITTLRTRSNTAARNAWYQDSIGLGSYAGQTVRLHFSATTDSSLATSFFVDDVSVR